MGDARFGEKHDGYEQDIINSLYLMFELTNEGSNQLEKFQSIIKQKPTIKNKKDNNLKNELNNIIKCLDYLERSNIALNVSVEKIFLILEKIIRGIDPIDFEEEMFDGFSMIINKLIVSFSKHHSLDQKEGADVVILKYGDLIALLHNVVITRINSLSSKLLKRLENNEKENVRINNKLYDLEQASKGQINAINKVVAAIKVLPINQRRKK